MAHSFSLSSVQPLDVFAAFCVSARTPAASSMRLTMSRAALGQARFRAFAAICCDLPGASSSAENFAGQALAGEFVFGDQPPAPACAISCALRSWWLSVARPNGMKMAARPAAATSAAVMAPARQTIMSAQANVRPCCRGTERLPQRNFAPRVGSSYRVVIAFAGLVDDAQFVFSGSKQSIASTNARLTGSAPWLPPVTSRRNGFCGMRGSMAKNSARTGHPVTTPLPPGRGPSLRNLSRYAWRCARELCS